MNEQLQKGKIKAWMIVWVAGGMIFGTACRRAPAPNYTHEDVVPAKVAFEVSTNVVACYDFLEITVKPALPAAPNPFTAASVSGFFGEVGTGNQLAVDGFCDANDGSRYRIRFMPALPGTYEYVVTFRQGNAEASASGRFTAIDAGRRGLVRTDPAHPWHFVWEGTGEHYFLNGTTAFLLMGWDDEKVIRDALDRLHRFEVNRVRVLLDGRTDHFWTEPIRPGPGFQAHLNPWPAARPDDVHSPGFDYARFNCAYWQKFERMLQHAREQDMIVSVIFGWNDTPVHPAADSEDERRYFRYAVARLAAYANVTWDLGDDMDGFRSTTWTHETGSRLYRLDPYHHLATSHPVNNAHQDRTALWFGMTSFQEWHRPLHAWMLNQRRLQTETGRIIPQVNEEYGYEDHYPTWAPYHPPAASADADRRAAWEMVMAGCYQTTGETARRGTGVPPDTGGGWVNGRGDASMTMLQGYQFMVRFFTRFAWWKTDPHDELVDQGYCLAEPGEVYVIYLPHGGQVTASLEPVEYDAQWFNPRTGEYTRLPGAIGPKWTSPAAADHQDWVLFLRCSSSPLEVQRAHNEKKSN